MFTSLHHRGVARNYEQSQRQLTQEDAALARARDNEAAAEAAYEGLPADERRGLGRSLVPWLLAISLVMEMPGAWMAAAAATLDGLTLLVCAVAFTVGGVLFGLILGRARARLNSSDAQEQHLWQYRIDLALATAYLGMLLSLRLNFAHVLTGSTASVLGLTLLSALGLRVAYACETDVESPEAFRRKRRMHEAADALTACERRRTIAVENSQSAGAELNRCAESSTKSANGSVVTALLIALAIVTIGGRASAQTYPDLTSATLAACSAGTTMPRSSVHISLIVLAGTQIIGERRKRYEQIASHAIAAACATGATLDIRGAAASGSLDSDSVFSATAPRPNGNPFALAQSRERFVHDATGALAHMYERIVLGEFDVVTTIRETAADLIVSPVPARYLVVAAHGWPANTFRAGADPRREMPTVIRSVQATGGLDLRGVTVFFAGIAGGPRMSVTAQQLFELCQSWRMFVIKFGGTFGGCGADLRLDFVH